MDNIKMLNYIRQNASEMYQERVPVATKNNIDKIGLKMAEYQPTMNEFLKLLVNKIAMTIVNSKMITNPLAQLKKGKMPMGNNIEELFTNPAIAKEYKLTSEDMLKVTTPDVKALYYELNRQDVYPVTISEPTLLRAFTEAGAMNSLISSITNSLYSGDNLDEFLIMKKMINDAIVKKNVITKEMPFTPDKMTEADSKSLIKELRTDSGLLTFPSSNYNSYKKIKPAGDTGKDVITFTDVSDQVLLIDSRIFSAVSVDVLASAFNIDKTDFIGKVIPVDDFGGAPAMAMLVDSAWFRIYDNFYEMKSMYNGETLNYTYWLHHWQVFGYSMFANAIAYTYTPAVTP